MTSYGHLPKTKFLDPPLTHNWVGHWTVFGGIKVYRLFDTGAIWAQEYWEWRFHALLTCLCFLMLPLPALAEMTGSLWILSSFIVVFPVLLCVNFHHGAEREIFSHAIQYQAGLLLGVYDENYEASIVSSLMTYDYVRPLGVRYCLRRMREHAPMASRWAKKHIDQISRVQRLGGTS